MQSRIFYRHVRTAALGCPGEHGSPALIDAVLSPRRTCDLRKPCGAMPRLDSRGGCPHVVCGANSDQNPPQSDYFFRSFRISRAALAPEPPVKPTPGWVPEPHRYRF